MSHAEFPKRGEVWWVSFGDSRGGEIQKTRPAIIISNDAANKVLNRVQIIPLTSSIENLYPSEAYVIVDGKQSKSMADQIATASKHRLVKKMGNVKKSDMVEVERVIKMQMGLL